MRLASLCSATIAGMAFISLACWARIAKINRKATSNSAAAMGWWQRSMPRPMDNSKKCSVSTARSSLLSAACAARLASVIRNIGVTI